jgi:predicted nucleic acid-binding Zn ribbon protein
MFKKPNEIYVGEAIREMVDFYNLKGRLGETNVLGAWEKIVGTMIARHTTNIYIKRRKLHVLLDSSVIRNELSYARSKLVKMLNDEAGESVIDEVVLM